MTNFQLPRTLLSRPLEANEIQGLSPQEQKQYRKWAEKFKSAQTQKRQQEFNKGLLKDRKWSPEEVKKLFEGVFYDQDEEGSFGDKPDQALEAGAKKVNKAVYLNRENLQNEMELDQFEEAIAIVASSEKEKNKNAKLDSIPDEIRKELNLPTDMMGFEIDFEEVRLMDASLKRKKFYWSGQDVLEESINKAMSTQVVKHFNALRVWPKFTEGLIKKARCLLKMLVKSSLFGNAMTMSVLGNTIVMAMDAYGISDELAA